MSVWTRLENGLADRRHEPRRAGADQPAAAAMAEVGPVLRDQRQGGRGARHARGQASCSTLYDGLAQPPRRATSARRSGSACSQIHAEQQFTIGIVTGVPQPVVVRNTLRNVPREGHLQLGSGRLLRHLPSRHLLVRRRAAGASTAAMRTHADLHPPAPPDHDPDAARDQLRHLHHHPAAAGRLPLQPDRRAAEPGRARRRWRRSTSCASSTASTSRSSSSTCMVGLTGPAAGRLRLVVRARPAGDGGGRRPAAADVHR